MRLSRAALVAWLTAIFSVGTVSTGAGAALYMYKTGRGTLGPGQASLAPVEHLKVPPAGAQTFLGVFAPGATRSYAPVDSFATVAGRPPGVVSYYNAWNGRFAVAFAQRAAAHGAVPLVQLLPSGVTMASIAAGRSDTFLHTYAQTVRAYAHPVIISFAPEMNGWWYGWGFRHVSGKTWVAAWRHVVTLFRQEGATNVTWLWAVNRSIGDMGPLRPYWPGPQYVDWVGIDGYYFTANQTFSSILAPTVASVRGLTKKPIFLSEIGVGPGADQAKKIPDLFAGIRRYHLIGLLWFNQKQQGSLYHQDWRLGPSKAGVAAFQQGLAQIKAN
jgi:Glycosyl hydrolase family 26